MADSACHATDQDFPAASRGLLALRLKGLRFRGVGCKVKGLRLRV